jgi:hypothetical protein
MERIFNGIQRNIIISDSLYTCMCTLFTLGQDRGQLWRKSDKITSVQYATPHEYLHPVSIVSQKKLTNSILAAMRDRQCVSSTSQYFHTEQ